MNKKIISLAVSIVILISTIPVDVYAADTDKYTINYILHGGVFDEDEEIPTTYDSTEEVSLPEKIKRKGSEFIGWLLNKIEHTVTFNANGGQCETTSMRVTTGEKYGELPSCTNGGNDDFQGWYTLPIGGIRITPETEVTATGNETLYAHWGLPVIRFASDSDFTLKSDNGKTWNGTLEYSTDEGETWALWNGSQLTGNADQSILMRGTDNTVLTGDAGYFWEFTGKYCTGNIETLLDYNKVMNGEHPAMDSYCFYFMFYDCTTIETAPELYAHELTDHCYAYMFSGCQALKNAPKLQATVLADYCYQSMFYNCTSLESAPALPSTTLANYCYHSMFRGCTSLKNHPLLPSTTLSNYCYAYMFYGCRLMENAPELPAVLLAPYCYHSMFRGCTSLVTPPELPAPMLADYCYANMFYGCRSLETSPILNAMSLAQYCYSQMFYNCTTISTLPELNATTLANYCYQNMFFGCSNIEVSATKTSYYQYPYRVPMVNTGTTANYALEKMLNNTGGTFKGTPTINMTYWVPYKSASVDEMKETSLASLDYALKFSSDDNFTLATNGKTWNGTLEYTNDDGFSWITWNGSQITGSAQQPIYVRGTANERITNNNSNNYWRFTGKYCTGNIECLLDYKTVANGEHPSMAPYCYYYMFNGCTNLLSAPELPAISLNQYCYSYMFNGCTNLEEAPELPATEISPYCYSYMFNGCRAISKSPQLPATTLADNCYKGMFQGCIGLSEIMELSAEVLAPYCYANMFSNCTNLKEIPDVLLPITTLSDYCYQGMFQGCTSLENSPELPAEALAPYCYYQMFYNCNKLKAAPALPATSLAAYGYYRMFYQCSSIEELPELRTLNVPEYCYYEMFRYCTSIKLASLRSGIYQYPYRIPTIGVGSPSSNSLNNMFANTGGAWNGTPSVNTTYWVSFKTESVDAMFEDGRASLEHALKFSSDGDFSLNVNNNSRMWNGTIEYTNDDGISWYTWNGNTVIYGTEDQPIYVRGTGNTYITYTSGPSYSWYFTGKYCEGNIEYLLDYNKVKNGEHPTMGDYCYYYMFYNCPNLEVAPELPSLTLSQYCYSNMFAGCSKLKEAPNLPATTLNYNCYQCMFQNCTGLEKAQDELPATTLTQYCYYQMFYGCTLLKKTPKICATATANYACQEMFYNCTALEEISELHASTIYQYCYYQMFRYCTSLKLSSVKTDYYKYPYRIPTIGTGSASNYSLNYMFYNTGGSWTGTPSINTTYWVPFKTKSVDTIIENAQASLEHALKFSSDSSFTIYPQTRTWDGTLEYTIDEGISWYTWNGSQLTGNAALPIYIRGTGNTVITGSSGSYYYWRFTGKYCTGNIEYLLDYNKVKNGEHPVMNNYCYYYMFYNCSSLEKAPELPATELKLYCYQNMFQNCTSLKTAPELPATVLVTYCYSNMFADCRSLITPPELPAMSLATYCYANMFQNCTSLRIMPELTATTLTDGCYQSMFQGCTALRTVSELSALTLAPYCYFQMFYGCTSIKNLPELPAATLPNYCYQGMFQGCRSVKLSSVKTEEYKYPYHLPTIGTGTVSSYSLDNMFYNTGGTWTGNPSINTTYWVPFKTDSVDEIVETAKNSLKYALKFSSDSNFTIYPQTKTWDGTLEYTIDEGISWYTWSGSQLSGNATLPIYIRGTGNTVITGSSGSSYYWRFTGKYCEGNIETLLDYNKVKNNEHPSMYNYCFYYMFYNCTNLEKTPVLPATTMVPNCYQSMFQNCTAIKEAPTLPATVLASYCYDRMFYNCSNLEKIPELPATTMAAYCYNYMFSYCSKLMVSDLETNEYKYSYKLPSSGTGTLSTSNDLDNMFTNTGGTFKGTPLINTTYYLKTEPIK